MKRMTIRPLSIPRIRFAHEYGSDRYDITFPIISDQLEISYLVKGDVLWESCLLYTSAGCGRCIT